MARIAGIDLPKNKRVEIALTYIVGIGKTTSSKILKEAGIDPDLGYPAVVNPAKVVRIVQHKACTPEWVVHPRAAKLVDVHSQAQMFDTNLFPHAGNRKDSPRGCGGNVWKVTW